MPTIRFHHKTAADGNLSFQIPLGTPETEYDVTVVIEPSKKVDVDPIAPTPDSPEARGWPPGYFERTFGSIDDETFFRHPQGEWPTSTVEFD